jgi:hypothetical protein
MFIYLYSQILSIQFLYCLLLFTRFQNTGLYYSIFFYQIFNTLYYIYESNIFWYLLYVMSQSILYFLYIPNKQSITSSENSCIAFTLLLLPFFYFHTSSMIVYNSLYYFLIYFLYKKNNSNHNQQFLLHLVFYQSLYILYDFSVFPIFTFTASEFYRFCWTDLLLLLTL